MKMLDSGDDSDHPYEEQFNAFFSAITDGVYMPLTGLPDAMKTFEVLFAAEKSAAEGRQAKVRQG